MASPDTTIWGMHGGKTGNLDSLFLKRNFIAVGWDKMRDLSKLPADREAFKARVQECYPEKKPGAIPNNAGQLFRFVHEMKPGDLVVYPSRQDHQVHLGRVTGTYKYDPQIEEGYPNLRAVKWIRGLPFAHRSQDAANSSDDRRIRRSLWRG